MILRVIFRECHMENKLRLQEIWWGRSFMEMDSLGERGSQPCLLAMRRTRGELT